MNSLECIRTQSLLDRRAVGLSDAEKLLVEGHVARCDSCRGDAELLEQLRLLVTQQNFTLTSTARNRLVANAFDAPSETRPSATVAVLNRRPAVLFLGAAAASVALWLVLAKGPASPAGEQLVDSFGPHAANSSTSSTVDGRPPSFERAVVLSGTVQQGSAKVPAGSSLETGQLLVTAGEARLGLGHASVRTAANTRLVWESEKSQLRLIAGRVDVDVDASRSRRFSVQAPTFRVDVLGTRFVTNTHSVSVTRGRVAVHHSGSQTVQLAAGERWQFAEEEGPSSAETTASSSAESAPAPNTTTGKRSSRAGGAKHLAAARAHLAAGRVATAERIILRALGTKLSNADRAEAQTLLAECASLRGDKQTAARRYSEVASEHEGSAAGENALFAAARAKHESGDWQGAQSLFTRYLSQYPRGRFRRDAHRHLGQIGRKQRP